MNADETPITLLEAASLFRGSLTPATLRAEAARGRLTIFKLGRRYFTTRADIERMVQKCREGQQVQGSISTKTEERGPSETVRAQSAQAALNQTVVELKKRLRNT